MDDRTPDSSPPPARSNVTVAKLLADIDDLQTRVARLEHTVSDLVQEISGVSFVEHAGVLFKRRKTGGYEPLPYCPECQVAMVDLEKIKLQCPSCRAEAPFKPYRLKATMDQLPRD